MKPGESCRGVEGSRVTRVSKVSEFRSGIRGAQDSLERSRSVEPSSMWIGVMIDGALEGAGLRLRGVEAGEYAGE